MSSAPSYDLGIVGGGLAGLALSIQAAEAGYSVIVFEKERYPFHKVCGEYISREALGFLERLGLPLGDMSLPMIDKLVVSAPNGKMISHQMQMGGIGISRFKIDAELATIAREKGVNIMEETKVNDIVFDGDAFSLLPMRRQHDAAYRARVVTGSFGKRSNLDLRWKRVFVQRKSGKLENYLGVKYHIKTAWPADTIALHNFINGYCGMSAIEEGKFCLCYLTTASNLESNNHSIKSMEQRVLYQNPHLKKIFLESEMLFEAPVTISQISFSSKTQLEGHVLLAGDAAGMITPLCGNGMSMALQGSKHAFEAIDRYLNSSCSRREMEKEYIRSWQKNFSGRLRTGRMIQRFFGSRILTNLFISALKPFPSAITSLVNATHGKPF